MKTVVYWISVVVVCLLAAELTARVDDRVRLGVPLLSTPDRERDLVLTDAGGVRGRPGGRFKKWKLNQHGFRSPETTFESPPGCVRVMVLGASETFGAFEPEGKEYPAQLRQRLGRQGCYEVLNGAIPGMSIRTMTRFWEFWGSRFGPDVVVVYPTPHFYLGETAPARPGRRAGRRGPPWWLPRIGERLRDVVDVPVVIQRRRVARWIANETTGKPEAWFFASPPADRLQQFVADAAALVESIRAHGAIPVLLTHAHRPATPPRPEDADDLNSLRARIPRANVDVILGFERASAEATVALAREMAVPVVDLGREMSGRREYFADFSHFSERGAAVVAELVADCVKGLRGGVVGMARTDAAGTDGASCASGLPRHGTRPLPRTSARGRAGGHAVQ